MNGRRPGRFTPELVTFFEALAQNIGLAVQRLVAEEQLQQNLREPAEANVDLAHFNRAAVGRELRMIELKKEVNALCAANGQPPRYPVDE